MKYGSVCSGIEAATVAWGPLGWDASFLSEIEPFPRAVLKHHYPDTPLHGDFTTIKENDYDPINLLVGGTPCQSFSIAGLRKGLDDDRGNLALEFLRLAQRARPTWVVWENVPGVLSSSGGRDFGAFLGGLGECGYGFAYRVLDAQYFGVAQRRRRVFVVGYLGDWRPAAAVLFERESLQGHPAPSREAGQGFTTDIAPSLTASGRGVERTGETRGQDPVVAHTLRAEYDASEDGTGRGTPLVAATLLNNGKAAGSATQQDAENGLLVPTTHRMRGFGDYELDDVASTVKSRDAKDAKDATDLIAFGWQNSPSQGDSCSEHVTPTLDKSKTPAVAFAQNQRDEVRLMDVAGALAAEPGMKQQTFIASGLAIRGRDGGSQAELSPEIANTIRTNTGGGSMGMVHKHMAVRRLTPVECERLQGFPDVYTAIPWRNKPAEQCPDGPRYKALGNSMAVPVMHWIGERIQQVNTLLAEERGVEIVAGMNSNQQGE